MKKFIYCGENNKVQITSTSKFTVLNKLNSNIVKTVDKIELHQEIDLKSDNKIRLAYICNFGQHCGISTYSKFILDKLRDKVDQVKVFSEYPIQQNSIETTVDYDIEFCWKRGEPLHSLVSKIKEFNPTKILIQHEWGIFPNSGYFMSFIIELKRLNIPTVVVTHSVYNHLDKQIPLSVIDNIIVHSTTAYNLLKTFKFKGAITVIPHGCPEVNQSEEIYNIFQTPYLLFGYGFGFKYKGVEIAIDAIKSLKDKYPEKYKDILYIYVCSESENNKGIHENYFSILSEKVKSLFLENNVLLIKGFLEPELLDIYLRTVKMVLFPYILETNGVYGSSGAIKIAMSYNVPIIASQSNLFDDVEGYITRISDSEGLSLEIDKIFSDNNYRIQNILKSHQYIQNTTWDIVTDKYLEILKSLR